MPRVHSSTHDHVARGPADGDANTSVGTWPPTEHVTFIRPGKPGTCNRERNCDSTRRGARGREPGVRDRDRRATGATNSADHSVDASTLARPDGILRLSWRGP